jgi:Ecdysteroid kinase-like family
VKAMMFDFQTLRLTSPMADLATFLANSTGTDVRSTHFSFIFKTYHEEVLKTLLSTLKKDRSEIPEIYRFACKAMREVKIFNLHLIFFLV